MILLASETQGFVSKQGGRSAVGLREQLEGLQAGQIRRGRERIADLISQRRQNEIRRGDRLRPKRSFSIIFVHFRDGEFGFPAFGAE